MAFICDFRAGWKSLGGYGDLRCVVGGLVCFGKGVILAVFRRFERG